jgi:hypothetical protein
MFMGDREPILPPRPPIRLLLWAAASAGWFRVRSTLSRVLCAAIRRGRRALAPREEAAIPTISSGGRESLRLDPWMFAPVAGPRERGSASERPTVAQIRRVI